MNTDAPRNALDLPPLEDVERALDLEVADRDEIPGLYNLNVRRVPKHRLLGMQALLVFAALHTFLIPPPAGWAPFLWVGLAVEVYAVGSYFALRSLFTRVRVVHLGRCSWWPTWWSSPWCSTPPAPRTPGSGPSI